MDSDGRILVGGWFAAVNGTYRRHLARLDQDGFVDPTFNPGLGLDGEVTAMALQPDGAIVVAGLFRGADGQSHGGLARLDAKGRVDPGFRVTLSGAAWLAVTFPIDLAIQPDGRLWLCGSFADVNGVPCARVARLEPDGTLDTSFRIDEILPRGNQYVDHVYLQHDGKVLLSGRWTNPPCSLIRLLADGTPDPAFVPVNATASDAGGPGHFDDLAIHSDGRIAVVGDFRALNGVARNRVAWLEPNGTPDPSFDPGSGPENSPARQVVIEPDGRTLIGGRFTRVRGVDRQGFARFNPDGSLDLSFDPGPAAGQSGPPDLHALVRQGDGRYVVGADDGSLEATNCVFRFDPARGRDPSLRVALQLEAPGMRAVALQPDGCLLVAGRFTGVNGIPRAGLARLGRDGVPDPTFGPGVVDLEVWAVAVQRDRKILLGGVGANYGEGPALRRLEPDGRPDVRFGGPLVQGHASMVETILPQPDGRIFIGGLFTTVAGQRRLGIARLHPDGALDESFQPPALLLNDDPGCGVEHIHVLPDGRVLIGGGFTSENGAQHYLARLLADGRPDASFVPDVPEPRPITSLAVQSDGKILIAGPYPTAADPGRVLRLLPNGAADPEFDPEAGVGATALAVQPDGRILVATNSMVAGAVVRLRPDGAVDAVWQTPLRTGGYYPEVDALLLQPDGRVLIAGAWLGVGGIPRPGLARLNNDASACGLRLRGGLTVDGCLPLEFTGIPGGRYVIETSNDLRGWDAWILLDDPVSPLDLLDPTADRVDHRFYRARLVP